MSLKDISYLFGALAALLFCGAEPFVQDWYRVSRGPILRNNFEFGSVVQEEMSF